MLKRELCLGRMTDAEVTRKCNEAEDALLKKDWGLGLPDGNIQAVLCSRFPSLRRVDSETGYKT